MDALVPTRWLAERLGRRDVRVVDGSWHMPQLRRDARAEFGEAHIPGAVFFDIDEIADTASPLPHMLPSARVFAARVGALGIGTRDRVVVYDTRGVVSAPRGWGGVPAFGAAARPGAPGPRGRGGGRPGRPGASGCPTRARTGASSAPSPSRAPASGRAMS